MPAIINRCGVLAGAWQMGKADQGVVTLWVARHLFHKPLKYIGFGGCGKQVRDLLHVDDLFDLLVSQTNNMNAWDGRSYNVGGGREVSVSLAELTNMCHEVTGQKVPVDAVPNTSGVDVRIYLTDSRKARQDFGWQPTRDVHHILSDISSWIRQHGSMLSPILG
jgi:CDP-paratose 2-epimerase